MDSPAASSSKISFAVMRVPVTTGLPIITLGSDAILAFAIRAKPFTSKRLSEVLWKALKARER